MDREFFDIKGLMTQLDFPPQAVEQLCACLDRMRKNEEFFRLVRTFEERPGELDAVLGELALLARECGENEYTLNLCMLLCACGALGERYRERGVAQDIFLKSMEDFRCKLLECRECEGVWGTFVAQWYRGFFEMTRFGLGRLQFERAGFNADEFEKCGVKIKRGEPVINFHIPSCGPLTRESRMDAYKRAYKFFGGRDGEPMAFVCDSWLLYPGHREFLPEGCNILDFMQDFDIIKFDEKETFSNAWRVFGRHSDLPPESLPRDTSLRRAYAQRLQEGKPTGSGYGIFFFDGERILGK